MSIRRKTRKGGVNRSRKSRRVKKHTQRHRRNYRRSMIKKGG